MGLMGALVPIPGILRISLPAMQIGMDPSGFLSGFVVLGDLVRSIKIPLGIPPKRFQQRTQACRGHPLTERSTEFLDRHGRILRRAGGQERTRTFPAE